MWAEVAAVASIIGVVVGAALWIQRSLGRVEKKLDDVDGRLEGIGLRLSTVEFQSRSVLKALPPIISSLITANVMRPDQGTAAIATAMEAAPISDFLRGVKQTTNPLTQADLDQFRRYAERLKRREPLSREEAQDFYRIADVITHEYPHQEASWLLLVIGGFLLGMALADTTK